MGIQNKVANISHLQQAVTISIGCFSNASSWKARNHFQYVVLQIGIASQWPLMHVFGECTTFYKTPIIVWILMDSRNDDITDRTINCKQFRQNIHYLSNVLLLGMFIGTLTRILTRNTSMSYGFLLRYAIYVHGSVILW
jgi:hypothetical protein